MSKKRRSYTSGFKNKIAIEAIQKNNVTEIARRYGLSANLVSAWRSKLSEEGFLVFENTPDRSIEKLKKKVFKLEQMLGKKEVELNLLQNFTDFYQSQSGI